MAEAGGTGTVDSSSEPLTLRPAVERSTQAGKVQRAARLNVASMVTLADCGVDAGNADGATRADELNVSVRPTGSNSGRLVLGSAERVTCCWLSDQLVSEYDVLVERLKEVALGWNQKKPVAGLLSGD